MAQSAHNFEIVLPEGSISLEEWRKAQALPASELRKLSPDEKEVARKLGITEEALVRSEKASEFGRERMHKRAQEFGEYINQILGEFGLGSVDGLKADIFQGRWLIRVTKNAESVVIDFPDELVNDLLDSPKFHIEQVKRLVRDQMSAAGRAGK
jgi:hypothetical protein